MKNSDGTRDFSPETDNLGKHDGQLQELEWYMGKKSYLQLIPGPGSHSWKNPPPPNLLQLELQMISYTHI